MQPKIDFVIPWVDGNDPAWKKEKEHYWHQKTGTLPEDGNAVSRFRDWENLKYWFRGVEKFAPWVNHIYFVTWGHVPEWLNCNHPKLTIVNHKDYIPNEYLPVFSPNPIEINFHRIEGLSEHFVYFNDDMFLTNHVKPDDFFVNGQPREMAILYPLTNNQKNDCFVHMLLTMTGLINDSFDKKESIKSNFQKWFTPRYEKFLLGNLLQYRYHSVSGLLIPHVPSALRKSTMQQVWNKYEDRLLDVTSHKFRDYSDITQYFFRYWEIMSGSFEPTNIFKYSQEFFLTDNNIDTVCNAINKQTYKMICINDDVNIKEFEYLKEHICSSFSSILSEKSSFEKDN